MKQVLFQSTILLVLFNLNAQPNFSWGAEKSSVIVTSRSQFPIPFRFDQKELTRLDAQQVHLFISRDQGKTWKQQQTAKLDQKKFDYLAKADGEYWFSVAVSDRDMVMHPEPSLHPPGLKIVVDRVKPQLNLTSRLAPGRQLQLSWNASDKHPDIESLELEFRNSAQERWNRVYVKKQLAGKTAWRIQAGQAPEIRGRFSDSAGNKTEKIVKLKKAPLDTKTIAVQNQHQEPASNQPPVIQPQVKKTAPVQSSHYEQIAGKKPTPAYAQTVSSTVNAQPQFKPKSQQAQTQNQFVLQTKNSSQKSFPATQFAQKTYQTGELPRYMNSYEFEMDYQVSGAGPSGVGVVELFITQDNGNQWWRYGVDADLKSPMKIKVPADGRYGFHFRIHSGVGNADAPPQPGQKPQIDLIVDSQKPKIQLTKRIQGRDGARNLVTVQWNYYDDQPAEKPISLHYSNSRLGPWEPIATNLENIGTHSFELPRNPPTRMYLKILARDACGNLAETISEKPLLIDLARPTARVLTIDPVR